MDLVSVIMPSYNTPKEFLREAVKSVLEQTYTELELLIIDDGSSPSVKEELGDIADSRIKVIENPGNKGLPYSLNNGIDHSSGKYIFRMDSDDICMSARLEKQVRFLEEHPDIDVLATFAQTFGDKEVLYQSATEDKKIKAGFLWKNQLVHPTICLRADTIKNKSIYYKIGSEAEDYEIWSRMAFENNCKFAVIPEALLRYRIHGKQVTKTNSANLGKDSAQIIKRNFELLNFDLTDEQVLLYCKLRAGEKMTREELSGTFAVLRAVLAQTPEQLDRDFLKQLYRKQTLKYCLKHKLYTTAARIPGIK